MRKGENFVKNRKILQRTLGVINTIATCFLFVSFFIKYILVVMLRDCPQVHLDTAASIEDKSTNHHSGDGEVGRDCTCTFLSPFRANLFMKRMTH